jgi:hypothetical protein
MRRSVVDANIKILILGLDQMEAFRSMISDQGNHSV